MEIAGNVDAARLKRWFEGPRRAKAGRGPMADEERESHEEIEVSGQDASDAYSVQDVGGLPAEPDTQPAEQEAGSDSDHADSSQTAEEMIPKSAVSDIVRKRLERERRKWSQQEAPKKPARKREKEPDRDVTDLRSKLEYMEAKAEVSDVLSEAGYRLNRRQRELVVREYLNSGDADPSDFIADFVESTLAIKPNTASVQQTAPKKAASNPPGKPASAGAPAAGSTFEVTGDILKASRDELNRLGPKKVVQLLEQQLRGRKIRPPKKR